MPQNITERATMGALLVALAASAAGSGCDGGGSSWGSSGHSQGGEAGMAPSDCEPPSCDDGFNCTIDVCHASQCSHTIGPNSGGTACPPASYCTVEKGCIAAPACATADDCLEAWKGDACKTNIKCDAASSVCTFDVLDKDKDGHSPPVCGGDDCDDSDPARFPGNSENCDGKDDDCDGQPDNGATCPSPLHECSPGGYCDCKPVYSCNGQCKDCDFQTDSENCGKCGHACPNDAACVSGKCKCPPQQPNLCGDACVSWNTPKNCGGCGKQCPTGATCPSGKCVCSKPSIICDDECVDPMIDSSNCGGCGNYCDCDCTAGICDGWCPGPTGGAGGVGGAGGA